MRILQTYAHNKLIVRPLAKKDRFHSPTRLYEKDGTVYVAPVDLFTIPISIGSISPHYQLIRADEREIVFVAKAKQPVPATPKPQTCL